MRNFLKIAQGVDMLMVQQQLLQNDYLWNQERFRTTYEGTPHVDVDDILVRFSPKEDLDPADPRKVMEAKGQVWYPSRLVLPALRPIVLDVGRVVGAYSLERLLITRVRPGGRILPHRDTDGAYVNDPDIQRYHIVVQGEEGSIFACGDKDTEKAPEAVQMLTGEVWWFDAAREHEVHNRSGADRIHALADYRLWA